MILVRRPMGFADRKRSWRRGHVGRCARLHRRVDKLLSDHGQNVWYVIDVCNIDPVFAHNSVTIVRICYYHYRCYYCYHCYWTHETRSISQVLRRRRCTPSTEESDSKAWARFSRDFGEVETGRTRSERTLAPSAWQRQYEQKMCTTVERLNVKWLRFQ